MSLQFPMDTNTRPLVSFFYNSSDEDMEVDAMSVTDELDNYDSDDDIQVLACYPFPPQLVAGRAMTCELTHCLNDLSLPPEDLIDSASTFTEPSQELLDWCVGGLPGNSYNRYGNGHPITQCSQLNPIRDSPWSPSPEEQIPTDEFQYQHEPTNTVDSRFHNPRFTGLGISISGNCGLTNETYHSGCVVCGKSYIDIREKITLGYIEQTHIAGEIYEQRIARRDAFQACMKAGSFISVPRGVSQAAACDGNLYQIMTEGYEQLPEPRVLPV